MVLLHIISNEVLCEKEKNLASYSGSGCGRVGLFQLAHKFCCHMNLLMTPAANLILSLIPINAYIEFLASDEYKTARKCFCLDLVLGQLSWLVERDRDRH